MVRSAEGMPEESRSPSANSELVTACPIAAQRCGIYPVKPRTLWTVHDPRIKTLAVVVFLRDGFIRVVHQIQIGIKGSAAKINLVGFSSYHVNLIELVSFLDVSIDGIDGKGIERREHVVVDVRSIDTEDDIDGTGRTLPKGFLEGRLLYLLLLLDLFLFLDLVFFFVLVLFFVLHFLADVSDGNGFRLLNGPGTRPVEEKAPASRTNTAGQDA